MDQTGVTLFEIAAILGALAWAPQVYRYVVRPKLKIDAHRQVEIGYSSFGPIMNVRLALSVSRKDAVVERMQIDVRHERGQSLNLTWNTLNETVSTWRTLSGEAVEQTKNQPAIALKVSTAGLLEKLVGFQDEMYQEEYRSLENAVIDRRNRLRRAGQDYTNLTIQSDEFASLLEFFERRFPWQEGSYKASIVATISGLGRPVTERFTFRLSSDDVERLKNNIASVATTLTQVVQEVPPEQRTWVSWNWAYPRFPRA